MQTHDLIQGTQAWHEHRAKYRNASDTPAVTGHSPYKSRSEFLKERATGIAIEIDPTTQKRFDDGHRYEALARSLMEEIIGQELFPVTGTEGLYSASFDGLTMLGEITAEHKTLNDAIRACSSIAELPIYYREQMEHQLMVSGAEKCLFMATLWDSNDSLLEQKHFWYEPDLALRQQIVAAWDQFELDRASYVTESPKEPAVATPIEAMPAVFVQVQGSLAVSDNLKTFGERLKAFVDGINTKPATDQDFADAEAAIKVLAKAEDALKQAKAAALEQIEPVAEMQRVVDMHHDVARTARLMLERLVKSEKESRKVQITQQAHKALTDHVAQLHQRLGGHFLPTHLYAPQIFGESIRGLKSLDSMRDKVATALANAKIECNAMADRIDANRKSVEDMSLCPDFAQICTKAPDDFAATILVRVNQRKEAEERRLAAERQHIQAEEQAKAQREAQEKARTEQARVERLQDYLEGIREYLPEAVSICKNAAEVRTSIEDLTARAITPEIYQEVYDQAVKLKADTLAAMEKVFAERTEREAADAARIVQVAPIEVEKPAAQQAVEPTPAPAESAATITLGQINARLAPIQISAAGLTQLGIEPAGRERSAVLYRESDFDAVCTAICHHVEGARGE